MNVRSCTAKRLSGMTGRITARGPKLRCHQEATVGHMQSFSQLPPVPRDRSFAAHANLEASENASVN